MSALGGYKGIQNRSIQQEKLIGTDLIQYADTANIATVTKLPPPHRNLEEETTQSMRRR